MKHFSIPLLLMLLCLGCKQKDTAQSAVSTPGPTSLNLRYAEGFKMSLLGNSKLVEVTYPYQGATSGYKYLLVPRGEAVPEHEPDTRVIFIPLRSIVCTSTTHIPLLDYLDETDKLVGFPTTDYISSEKMRKRIDEGKIQELGIDKGLNLERLASLKPDVVMGYTLSSDYGQLKKVEDLGVPVIVNAEYLEKHPLGRAEWIKFMAMFFNREKMADSLFVEIEKNYLETQAYADTTKRKPTVLSGIVYGDAWFLPGGQNYASKLLKDAGCNYLWGEDPSHGYLELSFESIYEKARNADLWIGVATFSSLEELKMKDHRYAKFKAFQQKQVYTYDARKGAKGGSEFMELGYLRPDIILKDLVKIAHPELLPDYTLYFHKKLE
ncbi:ABC transporter substrate-binding protein [Fulvivirgaceae bacterium PWU4]|uniref:ABC transporter substrate-binding protein n=1 Tax=Chryseosolibacter histidini TaxID=2782349 RepID=A0AAP2GRZ1_9BACT|nr:ABC transporter substrate-binding protein [Chryseosolibacter histidini]MBT1700555.1 ABC transporter substrate-binding protein [Chryseosolibacter histidini]